MEENQNQTKVPEFKPLTPGFDPMERMYTPYPCGEIYPSLEGVNRTIDSSDYCGIRTDIRYRADGTIEVSPKSLGITEHMDLRPQMKEKELSSLVGDGNIRPDYYNYAIDPVEYIYKNKLDFFQGNVVKYITRFREKNDLEDLIKARTYINILIEKEYGKESCSGENQCKCSKESECKNTCKAHK